MSKEPMRMVRRWMPLVALTVVFGVMEIGLTQCRMSSDRVTGVDVRAASPLTNKRSRCVHHCNDRYRSCVRKEQKRHWSALWKCKHIENKGERRACVAAEESRHRDELRACRAQKETCKRNCRYREGSGSGGR